MSSIPSTVPYMHDKEKLVRGKAACRTSQGQLKLSSAGFVFIYVLFTIESSFWNKQKRITLVRRGSRNVPEQQPQVIAS